MGRKHYEKRGNCSLQTMSSFSSVLKDLYVSGLFGSGLKTPQNIKFHIYTLSHMIGPDITANENIIQS